MKWTNRGHQFDDMAPAIINGFTKHHKVFLFGAAYMGEVLYPILRKLGCFGGFIDNDAQKQQNGYKGEKVLSLVEYLKLKEQGLIIICTNLKNQLEIARQLTQFGKKENEDFYTYEYFDEYLLPIVFAYHYDQCFVRLAQIVLTNKCTLKCEKCAHGCQVKQKTEELTLAEACETADIFFNKVDYVQEFVLIGGEPLLYRELADVIRHIGERYRANIGTMNVTVNGTVLPSVEVLEMCRKYQVKFVISDYTITLPQMAPKLSDFVNKLQEYQIEYDLLKYEEWVDYGFDNVMHEEDEQYMMRFFDTCKTPCREIRGSKYYYCVSGRASYRSYGYHIEKDDYLDFSKLGADYKKVILEYNLGYSKKGYLEMCRRCNGSYKYNSYKLPPARQMN